MCLGFYFDIFILSFIVMVLVFVSVNCFLGFGSNFTNMFVLLFLMVVFNFLCLFCNSILVFLVLLVFLSFYSVFLILYGYGYGFKIVIVVLFKGLADVMIILIVSSILFLHLDCNLDSFMFCGLDLGAILFLVFFVYSLLGLFGFWLFFAMEASYFISCFMHSCGFIATGFLFFVKISLLGVLEEQVYFINFVNMISLFSYLFFLLLFFIVNDCNKSFGFYSVSSICFLIFTSVNFPIIAINYFFLSSVINILIFEMLSFLNNTNGTSWVLCLLFIFNIFIYFLFFLLDSFSCNSMDFIYFIFLLNVFSLLLFSFKVFNLLDYKLNGIGFNFILFLVISLLFNNFMCLVVFKSWIGSFMSYMFLFLLMLNFNFYSFKYFSFFWLKVHNSFYKLACYTSFILLFYVNSFSINHNTLLKFLNGSTASLNNSQLLFYCMFIPVFILILV